MDFDDYEVECEKIQKENEKYLKMFEDDLKKKGFAKKTIRNHLSNVDFYINDMLIHYEPKPMQKGLDDVISVMGFFLDKCYASPTAVKSMIASIKKFYKLMFEHQLVDVEDYANFYLTVKGFADEWIEESEDHRRELYYF